jgi:hypothetical protein
MGMCNSKLLGRPKLETNYHNHMILLRWGW